jgi:PAS domain S-box-containing protein
MLVFPGPEVFQAVVDRIETGVYVIDHRHRVVYWNHGAERITGLRSQEMLGRSCESHLGLDLLDHNPAACVHQCPLERGDGEIRRDVTVGMRHRAGHLLRVRLWSMAIRNVSGEITGAVKVFTDRAKTADVAEQQSGLFEESHVEPRFPGRAAAEAILQSQIESCSLQSSKCALIRIKLEELEQFQRGHGHEAASAIVREVGRTLRDMMRRGDFLGGWTHGSFLAMLPGCGLGPLSRLGERMQEAASRVTISWWGDRLSLKASVRVAFVEPGDTVESLEKRLDDTTACVPDGKGAGV